MMKDVRLYLEAERRLWDRAGVVPTERWVTLASGGRVRVQEVGDGPPFVLLHGGSISGTSWATLAAALVECGASLLTGLDADSPTLLWAGRCAIFLPFTKSCRASVLEPCAFRTPW